MMFLYLSGTPPSLAKGFEEKCGWRMVKPIGKVFPDGEQYLRLSEAVANDLAVIQSLYPEQDRKIIELYLALEAINGSESRVKFLILPYIAYARQDKRFLRGEPISTRAIYQNLKLFGVDTIVTIDIHSIQSLISLGFKVYNILPHAYMLSSINEKIDLVLAPDRGALSRAMEVAKTFNIPYDYMDKFRDRVTGEIRIDRKELNVAGMSVAIVDDIISTGGTMAKATQALYNAGANRVIAVVSHFLMLPTAIDVLSSTNISKLVTANTILMPTDLPKWIHVIDVSSLICNEISGWVSH
ncbi:MAG: ribose-phosphate diphosphokinase [Ignisphaera sp.]|uniref:ribose-phosphate diphosphokinase n=1 Tax=Ignisphaera aggregans TaxID=334771 RepID=A0A7J3JPU1_9CREN